MLFFPQIIMTPNTEVLTDEEAVALPLCDITLDRHVFYRGQATALISLEFESAVTDLRLVDIDASVGLLHSLAGSGATYTVELVVGNNILDRHGFITTKLIGGGYSSSTVYTANTIFVPKPLPEVQYNVRDYGLVGDGVTDDTAALNTLRANTTITNWYFPAGYTFKLNSVDIPSHLTAAYGEGTIMSTTSGGVLDYNPGAFELNTAGNNLMDGFVLEGLTFTTDSTFVGKSDYSQVMLYKDGGAIDRIEVRNCTFDGSANPTLGGFKSFATDYQFNEFYIYENEFKNIVADSPTDLNTVSYFGMEIIHHSGAGLHDASGYSNLNVFSNKFYSTDPDVYRMDALSFSVVRNSEAGNYCYDNEFDNCAWGVEYNACDSGNRFYGNRVTNGYSDVIHIGGVTTSQPWDFAPEIDYNHIEAWVKSTTYPDYGRVYTYGRTEPHVHHNYFKSSIEYNDSVGARDGKMGTFEDNIIVVEDDALTLHPVHFKGNTDMDLSDGRFRNNTIFSQKTSTNDIVQFTQAGAGVSSTGNVVSAVYASAVCYEDGGTTVLNNECNVGFTGDIPDKFTTYIPPAEVSEPDLSIIYELTSPLIGDGNTYIDTGWRPSPTRAWALSLTLTTNAVIEHNRTSGHWDLVDLFLIGIGNGDYLYIAYGGKIVKTFVVEPSTQYKIVCNFDGTNQWAIAINDTPYASGTVVPPTFGGNFYLGAYNTNGVASHHVDYVINSFLVRDMSGEEPVEPEEPEEPGSVYVCTGEPSDINEHVEIGGVTGNGSDERAVLQSIIGGGGKFIIDGLQIRIDDEVTHSGSLSLVGRNGAKIYSGNTNTNLPESLIHSNGPIRVHNLEMYGGAVEGSGPTATAGVQSCIISFHGDVDVQCSHLHGCATNSGSLADGYASLATGITVDPRSAGTFDVVVKGNLIENMYGYKDGVIANGRGGARAVYVSQDSNTEIMDVQITDNTFHHILGEEGDCVFVYDHHYNENGASRYEIARNTMTDVGRRAVKWRCDNISVHHNHITTLEYPSKWIWVTNTSTNSWNVTSPISVSAGGYHNFDIHDNTINVRNGANSVFSLGDGSSNVDVYDNDITITVPSGAPAETALALVRGTHTNVVYRDNAINTEANNVGVRTLSSNNGSGVSFLRNQFTLDHAGQTFLSTAGQLANATYTDNCRVDPNNTWTGGSILDTVCTGAPDPTPSTDLLYSEYQVDLGNLPLYDSNNTDHLLIPSAAQLGWLNTSSAHYFYLQPGVNYMPNSALTTITASGTATSRKYLLLNDDGVVHPGTLPESQQALIRLYMNGASFWTFHRLSAAHDNTLGNYIHWFQNGASDNVTSMFHLWDFYQGMLVRHQCDRNVFQHCYIHDQTLSGRKSDKPGISVTGNDWDEIGVITDVKIVANEFKNCNDGVQSIYPSSASPTRDYKGLVIDANHFWIEDSLYTNGSGSHTTGGSYAYAENGIDLKVMSSDANNPTIISNNKVWGMRYSDQTGSGLTDAGVGILTHDYTNNIKCLIEGNIVFDCHRGIRILSGHEVRNNILAYNGIDGTPHSTYWDMVNEAGSKNGHNIHHNTFVRGTTNNYALLTNSMTNSQFNDNLMVSAKTFYGALGSGSSATRNYFYASTDISGDTSPTVYTTAGAAAMSNLVFEYDIYSGSSKTKTVANVLTTASSPHNGLAGSTLT